MVPSSLTARLCAEHAAIILILEPVGVMIFLTVEIRALPGLPPSSPQVLFPQHYTVSLASNAKPCMPPAAIATIFFYCIEPSSKLSARLVQPEPSSHAHLFELFVGRFGPTSTTPDLDTVENSNTNETYETTRIFLTRVN